MLGDLMDSDDEDIVEPVYEAMAMAAGFLDDDDEDISDDEDDGPRS